MLMGACGPSDMMTAWGAGMASEADTQSWTLEKNGNFHLSAQKGGCLALQGGDGPGLVMFVCKTGTAGANEMWTIAGGQLCSHKLGTATSASFPIPPLPPPFFSLSLYAWVH